MKSSGGLSPYLAPVDPLFFTCKLLFVEFFFFPHRQIFTGSVTRFNRRLEEKMGMGKRKKSWCELGSKCFWIRGS